MFEAVQHAFAPLHTCVFYVMAGLMSIAFVLALIAMPAGRAEAGEARRQRA